MNRSNKIIRSSSATINLTTYFSGNLYMLVQGQNKQTFVPLIQEANGVSEVIVSSQKCSSWMVVRPICQQVEAVKKSFVKANVFAQQLSSLAFKVTGILNIQKTLNHLRAQELIAADFRQTIVENFPKAYGGTENLDTLISKASSLANNTFDLHLLDVPPQEIQMAMAITALNIADSSRTAIPASLEESGNFFINSLPEAPRESAGIADSSIELPEQTFSPKQETQKSTCEFHEDIVQKNAINETQKHIVEATLSFFFEDLQSVNRVDHALKIIELIGKSTEFTHEEQLFLETHNCLEGIELLRKILTHPCPQNRMIGDYTTGVKPEGVKNGLVYFWKNGFGSDILSERQGLLGLSARDDATAPPITRDSLINYVNELINKQKAILEEKNNTKQNN